MFKRIASLLLTLCMLCACVPAFAETANEPYEYTMYVDYNWFSPADDSWGDDAVSQYLAKKFNITLHQIGPDADSEAKLNTMIAADELPEVIYMDTDSRWRKLVDLGKLIPLDQFFEVYPQFTENIDASTIELLKYNGSVWCVPQWARKNATGGNFGFMYNSKIYESVGSPKLETLDDLYAYAKLVKEQASTYDGKNVVPIQGYNMNSVVKQMYASYGGIPAIGDYYTVLDNQVKYAVRDEKFKQALLLTNQFYREGLMNLDFATETEDQVKEKVANGTFGMYIGDVVQMRDSRRTLRENDPTVDFIVPKFLLAEGMTMDKYYGQGMSTTGNSGFCITTKAEHPERIFELLSYMLTKEYAMIMQFGPQGLLWDTLDANGVPDMKIYPEELSTEDYLKDGIWYWPMPAQSDNVDAMKFAVNAKAPAEKSEWISMIQDTVLSPAAWIDDEFINCEVSVDDKSDLGINRARIEEYIDKKVPMAIMAASAEDCEKLLADIIAFVDQNSGADIESAYTKAWEDTKTIMGKSNLK